MNDLDRLEQEAYNLDASGDVTAKFAMAVASYLRSQEGGAKGSDAAGNDASPAPDPADKSRDATASGTPSIGAFGPPQGGPLGAVPAYVPVQAPTQPGTDPTTGEPIPGSTGPADPAYGSAIAGGSSQAAAPESTEASNATADDEHSPSAPEVGKGSA